MLSGESAIGLYGEKALDVLRTTSTCMEQSSRAENRQTSLHQLTLGVSLPDKIAEQICSCAVEMGIHISIPSLFPTCKCNLL